MNVGDRVRFRRKSMGPWDERAEATGMVIGYQGQNVVVEVDGTSKETLIGPESAFRRMTEYRTQQPTER